MNEWEKKKKKRKNYNHQNSNHSQIITVNILVPNLHICYA